MKDLGGAIAPLFLWRNEPQRAQRAQSRVRGNTVQLSPIPPSPPIEGGDKNLLKVPATMRGMRGGSPRNKHF
ncbi:MAG: hypothetical protein EAZ78_05465 [Oscillatoriales cyanobacterium]|nr:MAG: hypothetical protein EAZ78_05465 [Oscillatoriales cyanobacterium]TAF37615.1 MAG: hypothetical protein EAZ68_14355 [Oscillatoriales cyanobacterium]TAF62900.1 MAG: hypothetical protein EAZ59_22205 [Oscillatoriales cyanobacterium]